ncbi:MAG: magnesium transporter [Bacteroides sp. SM23_62_1]|nr:MAG: magnesium transporter [Bacteroides sp. SM23_62_1]
MARFIKDRSKSKGTAPGSLILIGDQKMEKPIIRLMEYDAENLIEKEIESIEEIISCKNSSKVSWINIWGIHDLDMIHRIGEIFELSPLFLEDLLNTDQQPKYEDGDSYDGFIMKMLRYNENTKNIISEQLTLVLGEHYVLTLQEQVGDVFDHVRSRIRNTKGRIRLNDNDYLAYALMDTVVDNYVLLIESVGRQIEQLEERIFHDPDRQLVEEIYHYKTEINYIRKSVRPAKDMMNDLFKAEQSFFHEKNRIFLKDLNELVLHATDAIELYSSMISDQLNIYHTNVSNKMNEVMKVLTIFGAIFIPLTFVAGIYGMNFVNIPELRYKYGYFIFLAGVVVISGGLLLFFKRKKWL